MSDNILGCRGQNKQQEEWECFCDESYYGMWAVKLPSMKFEETFHLQNKDEAEGLVALLNKYKVVP